MGIKAVFVAALATITVSVLVAQPFRAAESNATLTAVPGIKVGHFTLSERPTGCTVILVDGDVKTLLPSAQPQSSTDPDRDRVTARYMFGRVIAVTGNSLAAGLTDLLNSTAKERELHWSLPANTAPDWGAIEGRGFRLRIPGIEGIPARAYLAILALFSVLIGPVNYWLLRRKQRQVMVVLTAPLISAAFIVLLAMTGLDLGRAALLSFSAAIIGAGIEAVCVRGFDNLFVPLGLFVFVIEQMNALTSHLAILATVLLIASCSVVFLVFARQRTFTSVAGVAILLFAV